MKTALQLRLMSSLEYPYCIVGFSDGKLSRSKSEVILLASNWR